MGAEWMRRPVKFHDFKLTNNPDEDEKHMVSTVEIGRVFTPVGWSKREGKEGEEWDIDLPEGKEDPSG